MILAISTNLSIPKFFLTQFAESDCRSTTVATRCGRSSCMEAKQLDQHQSWSSTTQRDPQVEILGDKGKKCSHLHSCNTCCPAEYHLKKRHPLRALVLSLLYPGGVQMKVLYTCCVTRAIHLDLVNDIHTKFQKF